MIGYWNYTVYATYASALSALFGFMLCLAGKPLAAVVCLLLSAGLDMVDGRIARTKTDRSREEKRFGVQLDSLADLLAFGALPCLIYVSECRLVSGHTGFFPALLGALFALCCLIRLAFFNVLDEEKRYSEDVVPKGYVGLPVTSAALIFPVTLLMHYFIPKDLSNLYIALLLVTGFLFLGKFRVRKPGKRMLTVLLIMGAAEFVLLLLMLLFPS